MKSATKLLTSARGEAHAGLVLEKGLAFWDKDKDGEKLADGAKTAHHKRVSELKVSSAYPAAYNRRSADFQQLEESGRGLAAIAKADGRLIVGLGAKGVTETGITLEHTWGIPVIPGSSLKGLAAAASHHLAKSDDWRKRFKRAGDARTEPYNNFDWLFGSTDHEGAVVFHDAWWKPNSGGPLDLDVMTTHHPKYYSGEDVAPSDFDSPTPISFLTAQGEFLLCLEGEPAWTDAAYKLLQEGLRLLGAGSKTNAGYGRMTLRESDASAKAKKAVSTFDAYAARAITPADFDLWAPIVAKRWLDLATPHRTDARLLAIQGDAARVAQWRKRVEHSDFRALYGEFVEKLAPTLPAATNGTVSCKVTFIADPKTDKRYQLDITHDGKKKKYKSQFVALTTEQLGKLKALVGKTVDLDLVFVDGKPARPTSE